MMHVPHWNVVTQQNIFSQQHVLMMEQQEQLMIMILNCIGISWLVVDYELFHPLVVGGKDCYRASRKR